MSTMEQEIEDVLRAAPRPAPPAGLKGKLIAQVRLPAVQPAAQTSASPLAPTGWLRRWWPVLAPAAASLACAVGLTLQQAEIRDLDPSDFGRLRSVIPRRQGNDRMVRFPALKLHSQIENDLIDSAVLANGPTHDQKVDRRFSAGGWRRVCGHTRSITGMRRRAFRPQAIT